jgi:ABC-2 type transport system permease protein
VRPASRRRVPKGHDRGTGPRTGPGRIGARAATAVVAPIRPGSAPANDRPDGRRFGTHVAVRATSWGQAPMTGPSGTGGAGMTAVAVDTWFMIGRQTRNLLRQPVWIVVMLTQPLFWLLLYSQLFKRVVDLPGFGNQSYLEFLTPGIVIMTAFFSATWSGMAMIEDLDRKVIDRFLATPVSRISLVLSQVVRAGMIAAIQTVIILGIAWLLAARVERGAVGWIVMIAVAALVAAGFAGISHGLALIVRREETLIAVLNFFGLPLTFVSAILIAQALMPAWMRWAAKFNPVQWGVVTTREMANTSTDWGAVGVYLGLLLAFTAATTAFATWAFRAYRRTL